MQQDKRSTNLHWKKEHFLLLALTFLLMLLLYFSPAEETLGSNVKLIYFHASIAQSGIIFFILAGILALFSLKKMSFFSWSKAFELMAFTLWIVQSLLGALIMKLVWGGFLWSEPKVKTSLIILFGVLVLAIFSEFFREPKFLSIAYVVMSITVLVALATTKDVFHPKNAIGSSPSLELKVFFGAIFLTIFSISFILSTFWRKQLNS